MCPQASVAGIYWLAGNVRIEEPRGFEEFAMHSELVSLVGSNVLRVCRTVAAGLVCVISLACPIQADTLFSSFGPSGSFTTTFGWAIVSPTEMAYPFLSPEKATFDSAALALAHGPFTTNTSVNIDLRADAFDSPGVVLESFDLVDVLPVAGLIAPAIVVDSVDHPLLEANTTYWLSISGPPGSGEIDWGTASIMPPSQRATRSGPDQPWSVVSIDFIYAGAFSVDGTPPTPTPEPSSALLVATMLLGIVALRRIRASRVH